jgi:hypothetical protein
MSKGIFRKKNTFLLYFSIRVVLGPEYFYYTTVNKEKKQNERVVTVCDRIMGKFEF